MTASFRNKSKKKKHSTLRANGKLTNKAGYCEHGRFIKHLKQIAKTDFSLFEYLQKLK